MFLRLSVMQFSRSPVIWLVPTLVIAAWFLGRDEHPSGLILWPVVSGAIGMSTILVGPLAAGVAAWIAGRARKQHRNLLLASTPGRGLAAHGSMFLTTLLWTLLAYAIYGIYQIALGIADADWGYLDIAPVLLGAAVILASVSIGYAVGMIIPSVFTPLIAAAGLVVVFLGVYQLDTTVSYLSPIAFLGSRSGGVLSRYWPTVQWPMTAWLIGLGGVAITLAVRRIRSTIPGNAALAASLALLLVGAGQLIALPGNFFAIPREEIPYTPVCAGERVPVCVHPAYVDNLDETVRVADAVFGPVAGLSGIPTRINQFPDDVQTERPYQIYFASNGLDALTSEYVLAAVNVVNPTSVSPAQMVIGRWLGLRVGPLPSTLEFILSPGFSADRDGGSLHAQLEAQYQEIVASVERFAALPEESQRAWLEANWDALRSGVLGLDALP